MEFFRRGQPASSLPARGFGERCKLPSGVWGGTPAAIRFSCILETPHNLSWNLLGAKYGGGMALLPHLNPPVNTPALGSLIHGLSVTSVTSVTWRLSSKVDAVASDWAELPQKSQQLTG